MMRKSAASAILALALVLSACGGGGRPSEGDIAEALKSDPDLNSSGDIPDEQIECVAEALHDSDVSDEVLQAMVDGDEDYTPSGDDQAELSRVLGEELFACLSS